MTTAARQLDTSELKQRVQSMYEEVALEPGREFHFETGRLLAERLGYPPAELDRIPPAAIDSFAGSERIMFALPLRTIDPLHPRRRAPRVVRTHQVGQHWRDVR